MFCMYFVDFVADIFVSCMTMKAGGVFVCVANVCKLGRAVFREEAFHVIICVLLLFGFMF